VFGSYINLFTRHSQRSYVFIRLLFSRVIERENLRYQRDLVFQRADNVRTVHEIRYSHDPVGVEVNKSFARAIEIYEAHNQVSLHRVLISASGR